MLVSQTESNNYFGRMLIGKIQNGALEKNKEVIATTRDGKVVQKGKIVRILKRVGMADIELEKAICGDIISFAGISDATVSCTVSDPADITPIEAIPIDPPLLTMSLTVNDSPYHGDDGDKTAVNQIVNRLIKEAEDDVSLKVDAPKGSDVIKISGRGDLHLGILIEKMRREGFELQISPPEV